MSLYKKLSAQERKREVLYFIKGGNLQSGSKPGFPHFMKLSYNTINKDGLQIVNQEKILKYRYKFDTSSSSSPSSSSSASGNGGHNKPSVGLFTSIMDELTANACYSVGLPSAPGLSLQMETELLSLDVLEEENDTNNNENNKNDDIDDDYDDGDIDIINYVTKLGRTISFTKTEFVHVRTKKLLAISSHVKYMPTGNAMLDFFFNTSWAMNLYNKFYVETAKVPTSSTSSSAYEAKSVQQVMDDSFEYHDDFVNAINGNDNGDGDDDDDNATTKPISVATFRPTYNHTNPFGTMYGGCHAIVMEMVGGRYVERLFWMKRRNTKNEKNNNHNNRSNTDNVKIILQSIQIEFLSASKPKSVLDVQCQTISITDTDTGGTSSATTNTSKENVSSSSSSSTLSLLSSWMVQVSIVLPNGRTSSEGKLRFAIVSSTSSPTTLQNMFFLPSKM